MLAGPVHLENSDDDLKENPLGRHERGGFHFPSEMVVGTLNALNKGWNATARTSLEQKPIRIVGGCLPIRVDSGQSVIAWPS